MIDITELLDENETRHRQAKLVVIEAWLAVSEDPNDKELKDIFNKLKKDYIDTWGDD